MRPQSGFPPAPRPLVSWGPSWILVGARLVSSACASVLAAMNSTPSRPLAIIVLSAFPPPPPTPMTLIRACSSASSANSIEMPISSSSEMETFVSDQPLTPLGSPTRAESSFQTRLRKPL